MFRKAFCFGLVGLLLCHAPVWADTAGRPAPTRTTTSSTTKRVVWTLVGVGAGFGAGVFIGLHAFDDAINSDRKVWTSAIVGAAAGGLAGGLLSRNVGRVPAVNARGSSGPRVDQRIAPSMSVLPVMSSDDDLLRRRVREIHAEGTARRGLVSSAVRAVQELLTAEDAEHAEDFEKQTKAPRSLRALR